MVSTKRGLRSPAMFIETRPGYPVYPIMARFDTFIYGTSDRNEMLPKLKNMSVGIRVLSPKKVWNILKYYNLWGSQTISPESGFFSNMFTCF